MIICLPDWLIKLQLLINQHIEHFLVTIRLKILFERKYLSTQQVIHQYSSRIFIYLLIVLAQKDLRGCEVVARDEFRDLSLLIRKLNSIIEAHELQVNVLLFVCVDENGLKSDVSVHNQVQMQVLDHREQLPHQADDYLLLDLACVWDPLGEEAASAESVIKMV
jgi:hypothetical protein